MPCPLFSIRDWFPQSLFYITSLIHSFLHAICGLQLPTQDFSLKSQVPPTEAQSISRESKHPARNTKEECRGEKSSSATLGSTHSYRTETLIKNDPTSFKEVARNRYIEGDLYKNEPVFEDSDESESGGATDSDNEEGEWEDDDDNASDAAPIDQEEMFQRVKTWPNYPKRSLLTPKAFWSQQQAPKSRPITITMSNTHSLALSPRTTRQNMLFSELTESVRKDLLWQRQVKKPPPPKSPIIWQHTPHDLENLQEFTGGPTCAPFLHQLKEGGEDSSSWNQYFDHGLFEYHERGW